MSAVGATRNFAIMKRHFAFLLSLLLCGSIFGQTTYKSILRSHPYINIEGDEVEFPSEPMWYTEKIEKLVNLLNKDVFSFYDLNDKYPTELQKNCHKKSDEYINSTLPSFDEVYNATRTSKFYTLYNLRYNKSYDTQNRCFNFSIGIPDYRTTKLSGYIGLGGDFCISFPTNRVVIKKNPTDYGDYYLSQYVRTPIISEEMALRIEKEMEKPTCSIYLMFIVQPNKISRETRTINYGGNVGRQNVSTDYILAQTIGWYIVDIEKEIILCDLSDVFSKATSNSNIRAKENIEPIRINSEEHSNTNSNSVQQEEQAIRVVEETSPEFPGGDMALFNFVNKNLKYPKEAVENGEQGKVFVEFTVDKNGSVVNPRITRGVSKELDNEAIRVFSLPSMPKWKPGTQNGKPVDVKYRFPIQFCLPY